MPRSKPRSVSREVVKTAVPLQSKTLLNPLKRPLTDSSSNELRNSKMPRLDPNIQTPIAPNDLINSKMPRPDPNILTPMVKKHIESNRDEASRPTCSANQNLIDNTASTQPKRKTTSSITITPLGPNRLAPKTSTRLKPGVAINYFIKLEAQTFRAHSSSQEHKTPVLRSTRTLSEALLLSCCWFRQVQELHCALDCNGFQNWSNWFLNRPSESVQSNFCPRRV